MPFQQTHTYAERSGGEESQAVSVTTSAEARINLLETADGNATTEIVMAVAATAIRALYIRVSGACVLKTNSADTPDNTLTFPDAGACVWDSSSPSALAITEDIESLFVTVAGESDVEVSIRCLYDPTPPP